MFMARRLPAPAWHHNVTFGVSVFLVTAVVWAISQMLLASTGARIANASAATVAIRTGGNHMLEAGPWVWTAPEGGIIRSVSVTVGHATRTFSTDEASDCYVVKGIGTRTVEVFGSSDGFCDPISNVVFNVTKK
jgi:hypothetical protein